MMGPQAKRTMTLGKSAAAARRPAGMQAIKPALYQQIRQAVQELSQPRQPSAPAA